VEWFFFPQEDEMHAYQTTFLAGSQSRFVFEVLFCALFLIGAVQISFGQDEGTSESPDANARAVTINFDTLGTGAPLSSTQYQSATFTTAAPWVTISTVYDAGVGGSYPNGIMSTSSSWNSEDVYVTFPYPVSGLSFRLLNGQSGGSGITVDAYSNGSYYTSFFVSGSPFGPVTVNLSNIPHVTRINIRQAWNCSPDCIFYYPLYYDDFTFTPEFNANITNPHVSGGLDQTNQNSLLFANLPLHGSPSVGNGTYHWDFTPANLQYDIVSGSRDSQDITIRPKDLGNFTATLTYTLFGAQVKPSVNVNVKIPTLTNFSAEQRPVQVEKNLGCSAFPGTTFTLGCQNANQPEDGIEWTATATIPSITYLSDPAESGIEFIQVVDFFGKRLWKGNRDCTTGRGDDHTPNWQLDSEDPYNHNSHPPRYFSESNTLVMGDFDAPGWLIEQPPANLYYDATLSDTNFKTYVYYFTSNPAGRDAHHPNVIYRRAIPFQNSQYPYAVLQWDFKGHAEFDSYNSPDTFFTLTPESANGYLQAVPTDEVQTWTTNFANDNSWEPCLDSPQTLNDIDASRDFIAELYSDFLGRNGYADPNGLNFWRSNITNCGFDASCIDRKRVDVARAFFYSGEFVDSHPSLAGFRGTHDYNLGFVTACYSGFLARDPCDEPDGCGGLNFWVGTLDSTNPDQDDSKYNEVLHAFLLSTEYRQRFGP
jgi:hypothetical protein